MTVIQDLELDTCLMRSFTRSANQARQHWKFGLKPGTSTAGIQQREKRIFKRHGSNQNQNFSWMRNETAIQNSESGATIPVHMQPEAAGAWGAGAGGQPLPCHGAKRVPHQER